MRWAHLRRQTRADFRKTVVMGIDLPPPPLASSADLNWSTGKLLLVFLLLPPYHPQGLETESQLVEDLPACILPATSTIKRGSDTLPHQPRD